MKPETYPALSDQVNASELCSYLEDRQYYCEHDQLLGVYVHLRSAVKIDGDKHSYLNDVFTLFLDFKTSVENHLRKERQLLYPFACGKSKVKPEVKQLINKEIELLKHEHEIFNQQLEKMRILTAGYKAEMSCSPTCKLCMLEMQELEADLKKMMTVEEKMLFPMFEE